MSPEPSKRERRLRQFHPETRFGGFTDLDNTIVFYARVQRAPARRRRGPRHRLRARRPVRGSGPDPARAAQLLRGHCERVIGIDVDSAGGRQRDDRRVPPDRGPSTRGRSTTRPSISRRRLRRRARRGSGRLFFAEARRVLRPGGMLCLRTVNVRSYLGLASRSVPRRRSRQSAGPASTPTASPRTSSRRSTAATPGRRCVRRSRPTASTQPSTRRVRAELPRVQRSHLCARAPAPQARPCRHPHRADRLGAANLSAMIAAAGRP